MKGDPPQPPASASRRVPRSQPSAVGACILLALALAAAAPAPPDEWTRFRGPNGSGVGHAENLPVTWTEKDYNWRIALPGVGHSSPVLWGGRIFLTSGDPKTARRFVLCLRAADGATLWQRDYESKKQEMNPANSYGTSTPAVDGERVYAYWTTPDEITLLALTHDGKDAWRRHLGPYAAEHGSGTSPIVFDNFVILANDQDGRSTLVALDRKTGKTAWEIERKDSGVEYRASYSTPMVHQPEGGAPQILFTSKAQGITAVDPAAGKVVWELREAFPGRCVSSPILAAGLIIASFGSGEEGQQVTAVRPPSKDQPAKIAWTFDKSPPFAPTAIAKDDLVFLWGDGGCVTCLRAATGEQVWRQRVGSNFLGSPIRVGGRLYCMSQQGAVFVVAASDKFELLARNPLGEPSHATPAVAGGVLYLRTFSHLISIGGR